MPKKAEIVPISVNVPIIEVFDIECINPSKIGISFKSPYYTCEILLGAVALQTLFNWLVKEQYVKIDGTLIIPIATLRRIYNGTS